MIAPTQAIWFAIAVLAGFVLISMVVLWRRKVEEATKVLLILWSFFGPILGAATTFFFTRQEVKQIQTQTQALETKTTQLTAQLVTRDQKAQEAEQLVALQQRALNKAITGIPVAQRKRFEIDPDVRATLTKMGMANPNASVPGIDTPAPPQN